MESLFNKLSITKMDKYKKTLFEYWTLKIILVTKKYIRINKFTVPINRYKLSRLE